MMLNYDDDKPTDAADWRTLTVRTTCQAGEIKERAATIGDLASCHSKGGEVHRPEVSIVLAWGDGTAAYKWRAEIKPIDARCEQHLLVALTAEGIITEADDVSLR